MTDDQQAPQAPAGQTSETAAPDEPLGDSGKRALESERAARKAAESRAGKIASRLLSAEVLAAAKGKLADPAMAAKLIDLGQFEMGEDGYDRDAVTAAVDQLVSDKPFLAARAQGFQGSGDGGARTGQGAERISRESLKGMSPQEIDRARREGKLDHLLRGGR